MIGSHTPKPKWCPRCNATVLVDRFLQGCVLHPTAELIDPPKRQPRKRSVVQTGTMLERVYGYERFRGKLMVVLK